MEKSTTIRVRYQETDQMGLVYNANYLTWFEIGRVEFLRDVGINYSFLEEAGVYTAVTESYCKYINPARYDEEIIIKTKIKKLTKVKVVFEYSLYKKEDESLVANGHTVLAFVNKDIKVINLEKENKDIWNLLQKHYGK